MLVVNARSSLALRHRAAAVDAISGHSVQPFGLRHLRESRRFHPGKNDIRKSPRQILIFLT
jgi:hypothetical protein